MFELIPFRRFSQNTSLYNPFRELEEMEKLFLRGGSMPDFKTDIKDNGDSYLLESDLPGFKKDDIKIDIEGDTLTISAERRSEFEEQDKKGNFIRCERSYGSYKRSFDISEINAEGISAEYVDGVLKLTMPKQETVLPTAKRLEIK
jgi:HSP20 family protein